MRAICAGLDIRNLNHETDINFSTITDKVQAGKWCYQCLPGRDEIAREHKISSTKQKPAMIPRDVEILYEEKQLVLLSSNKFNPQWLWTTSLLAPFNAVKLAKKALWWNPAKATGGVVFSQLRFLHRSFAANKFRNCIFDIKCCSNWTRDKGRERQSAGCFVDGSLHFLRNAILYSFSLSVIFSLFSRGS